MKKIIAVVMLLSSLSFAGVVRFTAKESFKGAKFVVKSSVHGAKAVAKPAAKGVKKAGKVAF